MFENVKLRDTAAGTVVYLFLIFWAFWQ